MRSPLMLACDHFLSQTDGWISSSLHECHFRREVGCRESLTLPHFPNSVISIGGEVGG